MIVLLAVDGSEPPEYFGRVATLAPLRSADEVILAHVVDSGPRSDLEAGRDRFMMRRPLSPERGTEIERAERERALTALERARQTLQDLEVSGERMRSVALQGRPNEELRHLAERERVDLIVVRGRGGKPGPHSLGKTARYLVDHTPTAALMVR
ncbi:MAG TPA: universal stress protein [Chloroflexota bacterium]